MSDTQQHPQHKQAPEPNPPVAQTDVHEFLSELDGGNFETRLARALSTAAAAAFDHDAKAKVTVEFTLTRIPDTLAQVRVEHRLAYKRPTQLGSSAEDAKNATVMHIGFGGVLSILPPGVTVGGQGSLNLGNKGGR
jgi:hypothetical protein